MAGKPFRVPSVAFRHLKFLNVPPERQVILCASPSQFVTLELHITEAGSTLCMGELYCDVRDNGVHRTRLYSYAPALALNGSSGNWERGILPIGNPWGTVADRDLRGLSVVCCRKARRDGSPGEIEVKGMKALDEPLLKAIGAEWFDVRPRLLQRYGVSCMDAEALQPVECDRIPQDTSPAAELLSFAEALAQAAAKRKGA